jgi:hypothetical protein
LLSLSAVTRLCAANESAPFCNGPDEVKSPE